MDDNALTSALRGLSSQQIQDLLLRSGHVGVMGIDPSANTTQTQAPTPSVPSATPPSAVESAESLDRTQACESLRLMANDAFKKGNYTQAADLYTQALKFATMSEKAVIYNNRAAAMLKLGNFASVIEDATSSIHITPSVKAYLRRADAFMHSDDICNAAEDAIHAHQLDRTHKEACDLVRRLFHYLTEELRCNPQTRNGHQVLILRDRMLAHHCQLHWIPSSNKGNPAPPPLTGHRVFPKPGRQETVCVCVGGRAGRREVDLVWEYSTEDDYWTNTHVHGDVTAMSWFASCAIDPLDVCLCHGGLQGSLESGRICVLDFQTSSPVWKDVITLEMSDFIEGTQDQREVLEHPNAPGAKSGHSFAHIPAECVTQLALPPGAEYILSVGGRSKGVVDCNVHVCAIRKAEDMFYCTWIPVKLRNDCACGEVHEAQPTGRDGHILAYISHVQTFVMWGGNGATDDLKYNDLWTLTLTRDAPHDTCSVELNIQWCHKNSAINPPPRAYAAYCMCDGCVCVFGGRGLEGELNDVWILDTDTWSWYDGCAPSSQPRAWAGFCRIGRELVCVCGGNAEGPLKSTVKLHLGTLMP